MKRKKKKIKKKNPLSDAEQVQQYWSQRRMLMESYGSKKSQRDERTRIADKVVINRETSQKKLDQIMEKQQLNEQPLDVGSWAVIERTKRSQLPPFDPDALDVNEVYLMDELFTDEEKQQLETKTFENLILDSKLMNTTPYNRLPSFILYYLNKPSLYGTTETIKLEPKKKKIKKEKRKRKRRK